ncbi:hypothetical protein EGW08_019287, partial [Elysia chlorotica]
NGIVVPTLFRIIRLPPGSGEDVLVPFIPTTQAHFSCVGFKLLYFSIVGDPNVVMNLKIKQRSRFSPGFCDDEVVETVVVWDDQILLHVDQLVCCDGPKVVELFAQR